MYIYVFVHKKSNHPTNELKNIAGAVNDRQSGTSSNEDMFNEAAKKKQEPLYKMAISMI